MSLIILDRDGVINYHVGVYITKPSEWIPIEGSLEAISLLCRHGFTVALATNQSGVAKGLYSLEDLESIHQHMNKQLRALGGNIDLIQYCPHHPDDQCVCRKPKPGMLFKIAEHYRCELSSVFFVGDDIRDVEAAYAAQCQPIVVGTGHGAQTHALYPHVPYYSNLKQACDMIVSQSMN